MRSDFRVSVKHHNGNLHVRPEGDFDGNSAWILVNFLHEQYAGRGRIFIDTNHLEKICDFGIRTFQCRLDLQRIPAGRITFTGKKASLLAPEGSRIVPIPGCGSCRCNGDCTSCSCARKKPAGILGITAFPPPSLCRPAGKQRTADENS